MECPMTKEGFESFQNSIKHVRELPEAAVDVTGTVLSPCKPDICKGNGRSLDENGELIECCCDEFDYLGNCCNDAFDDLTYDDYLKQLSGLDPI